MANHNNLHLSASLCERCISAPPCLKFVCKDCGSVIYKDAKGRTIRLKGHTTQVLKR